MPVLRFASYRQIASEVADRLLAVRESRDPFTPWPEEIIVPSRGAAGAISQALVERLPNGIAGLQVHSLERLAARIVNSAGEMPRIASEAERRLAMRTAVRTIGDPMLESRGAASMLERSYRDVRDSGISLGDFARRVSSSRGLRNGRRTQAIVRTWSEYERLIGQLDAIDPADLVLRAAALVSHQLRPQILAGFYDVTGAQLRLIESLLNAGRIAATWVPSDGAFAQPFVRAIGAHVEVVFDPSIEVRRRSEGAVTPYDTAVDELRGVCSAVAGLLSNGTPPGQIGIGARTLDAHDIRLLNRFARERGFRTTTADQTPLTAHRIGRGAVTLLRLRERGFPRADVLELVRDGFLSRTRINADSADAATRRARIAGGTSDELRMIRLRSKPVEDYISLVAEIEELTASVSVSLLSRLGSMFRIETESDLAAAEKLDEVADLFRRAAVWNKGFDAGSVIDAIEQISLTSGPHQETPAVWTGDIMRFRGRSFSHVFAVRMQDDRFPQRRNEDPILPDSDRRILGLREIGDGGAEETLLFSLMSASASHVHFSFAANDGLGKALRKSRYLRNLPLTETPRSASSQTGTAAQRQLQLLAKSGTRSPFDGYVGGLGEHVRTRLESISPTQLDDFGECPQKFLFKHILGVSDIDHPERELQITPRDKGTLDHAILERFYRSVSENEIEAAAALSHLPASLVARLDAIIDEQFDALETDAPPFNRSVRDIERRATKRILAEFLTRDFADLARQQLIPTAFEYRFGMKHGDTADHPEPFVIDAGGIPLRVEGTIDRIDTGGGQFRIVDYKSGKAVRHQNLSSKIDRGIRLQLPLYAMAVSEIFGAPPDTVSGTIKPFVAADVNADKYAFVLHEKRERLLQTLDIFVHAIVSGAFPAFPESKDVGACEYCPVNHSCRTRHDTEERYAVQQESDPRTLLSKHFETTQRPPGRGGE